MQVFNTFFCNFNTILQSPFYNSIMMRSFYLLILTGLFSATSCPRIFAQDAKLVPDAQWEMGVEFGFAFDPVYGMQRSDPFYLNKHNIGQSGAAYYCAIPGKHILQGIGDIFDEASCYYFPIIFRTEKFNKRRRFKMIPGVTHDKLQVQGPLESSQYYKFENGGTEITLMFSYGWKIARNIEIAVNDHRNKLIMNIDFLGGAFIDNDMIHAVLNTPSGDQVYANPSTRKFGDGHGYLAYINEELGWRCWDRLSFIAGFKIGGIYNHSVADVSVDNVSGSKLTDNTYGIFISPFIKVSCILTRASFTVNTPK